MDHLASSSALLFFPSGPRTSTSFFMPHMSLFLARCNTHATVLLLFVQVGQRVLTPHILALGAAVEYYRATMNARGGSSNISSPLQPVSSGGGVCSRVASPVTVNRFCHQRARGQRVGDGGGWRGFCFNVGKGVSTRYKLISFLLYKQE
jgi:hypothetical protein